MPVLALCKAVTAVVLAFAFSLHAFKHALGILGNDFQDVANYVFNKADKWWVVGTPNLFLEDQESILRVALLSLLWHGTSSIENERNRSVKRHWKKESFYWTLTLWHCDLLGAEHRLPLGSWQDSLRFANSILTYFDWVWALTGCRILCGDVWRCSLIFFQKNSAKEE